MSAATLKTRLERIRAPLTAAVWLRWARWLEELPQEDLAAGIVEVAFGGDLETMYEAEPEFRAMSEEEIAEQLRETAPAFIEHLREQAREIREGRRR